VVEPDVAGAHQAFRQGQGAAGGNLFFIGPVIECDAGQVVEGIAAFIDRFFGKNPGFHCRRHADNFKDRAQWVTGLGGAVEQAVLGGVQHVAQHPGAVVVVGVKQVGVERGRGCHCQHPAGVPFHDHDCPAKIRQRFLHFHLQVFVNGGGNAGGWNGIHLRQAAEELPAGVNDKERSSAPPAKVFLRPFLQPRHAHLFIAQVALALIFLQRFGGNGLHIAGNMRRGATVQVIARVIKIHHQPAQRGKDIPALPHCLGGGIAHRDVPVRRGEFIEGLEILGGKTGQAAQFAQQPSLAVGVNLPRYNSQGNPFPFHHNRAAIAVVNIPARGDFDIHV